MNRIVIASNNKHKIQEISAMVPKNFELIGLEQIGCFEDIPEEAETLEGNAFQKANYVYQKYKLSCFADDTGLEVEALGGKPGVHSARFSEDIAPLVSKEKRSQENMKKLMTLMSGLTNRNAAFRTVICFIDEKGKEHFFEGKINGRIIEEQRGTEGFGYDPLFIPDGYNQTFAEMHFDIKNGISHRALATTKFLEYLKNQIK